MSFRGFALLAGLLLVLPACNGTTGTPVPAAPTNISGDYAGTVHDSVGGTLTATALLAQHGSSAGGTLTTTGGSTQTSSLSLAISASNAVSGTMVQDLPGDVTCSFSMTGSYDPSTAVLSGSYTAITGCSGQSGTYALTQSCTDTVTNADRRPAFGVPSC